MLEYRSAELKDAEDICIMRNDISTRWWLTDFNIYSIEECKDWLTNIHYLSKRIVVEQENNFIGLIRIDNIDDGNKNCMIGLDITPDKRGNGYSTIIYGWLLNKLFTEFDMVYLLVMENNVVARSLYEKLGFKIDGTLRNRIIRHNKYYNYIYMSLLKSEFYK